MAIMTGMIMTLEVAVAHLYIAGLIVLTFAHINLGGLTYDISGSTLFWKGCLMMIIMTETVRQKVLMMH